VDEVAGVVVAPAPDDLHRRARGARDLGRLRRVVRAEAPAESAADQRDVHRDALGRDSKECGRLLLDALGVLRRGPDLAASAGNARDRVLRLDGRVRLEGVTVARPDAAGRPRQRRGGVAVLPRDAPHRAVESAVDARP
jgi:hypothetical protein